MDAYTLITGASGGIGEALAVVAAEHGEKLVLVARDEPKLHALAESLPTEAVVIACDLSHPDGPEKLAAGLAGRKLTIGTLINNAGVGDYGDFAGSDPERQEQMLLLNVVSLTTLTRLLLPDIIRRKGKIMNLGSVASFLPGPHMSAYFASKAYVLRFSEALHEELKPHGVSVTCLCPGATATGFGRSANVGENHMIARAATTAHDVAAYGWRAMQAGKAVAVYGLGNRLGVQLATRLLPGWLVRRMIWHANKTD